MKLKAVILLIAFIWQINLSAQHVFNKVFAPDSLSIAEFGVVPFDEYGFYLTFGVAINRNDNNTIAYSVRRVDLEGKTEWIKYLEVNNFRKGLGLAFCKD